MRRSLVFVGLSSLAILTLAGCTGDDSEPVVPDAGPSDAGGDATMPSAEAGADSGGDTSTPIQDGASGDAADAGPIGPYLLLSYYYDGYDDTEYSAFNVTTGTVQGGLGYAQYGVNVSTNQAPWVLEQNNNIVLRMDPKEPWNATSSWSVANVPQDTSFGNSDSFSVAEVGSKAYVLGYGTDYIAVLDTSQTYDGGAPTKTIPLVSDPDASGNLEPMALAYDASQSRVWVVLGNSNSPGYPPLCAAEYHPFVVAIDTVTDTVLSGVKYTLQGYGTAFGTQSVVFDSANDRLLIATEGCNDPVDQTDGAVTPGASDEAYIEQISLDGADAGADTILLTLSPSTAPTALVYVDDTHAFVQTYTGTYAWDPTQTTLGAVISNAPDTFVWDGHGLLGPQTTSLGDGGPSFAVVEVDPTDGGLTTLATNPFTPVPSNPLQQQAWQSVDIWPHP